MSWLRGASSPEDQFTSEVIALVRVYLGLRAERLDGFALRIEQRDGRSVTMNLRNIYAEAQRLHGEARSDRLRRAVLAMIPQPRPANWREAVPLLLPAVRTASWASAAAASAAAVPFGKPLVPFVKVVCAIDFAHLMSFATVNDLATWGVTDDEALWTASANLARIPCQVRRRGPVGMVEGPDGYASSWLAVPAALASAAAEIGDRVIAVAPTRDELVLIDAERPEAVTVVLKSVLKEYQDAARQLSPVPYLVSEAGIEPWTPPPGHPARPLADRAARYLAAAEYAHQQARLDDVLQKAGEDAYVARHTLMERPDGSLWSWVPWVRQVTNGLLPRADVLVLGDNDDPGTRFAVPWDDALRIAGDALCEEAACDPPRWRHHGWPDDDTMALLKASAGPLPPPPADAVAW